MARKPIHLQAAGKLTVRDRIWAAIRKLHALSRNAERTFTRADIADRCVADAPPEAATRRIEETTIWTYVEGLAKAGYLEIAIPYAHYRATVYKLARDVGVEAPRVNKDGSAVTGGDKRAAMWKAMKILRTCDRTELRNASNTDTSRINDGDAKNYITFLTKAGYLQLIQRSASGRRARYRFVPSKNTGPRAPQIQRSTHVYDPNLGQVVWHPAVNS